jgi:serine/threonine protein kinase
MRRYRWEQIETLLHSALACAPDKRAAFLDHACGGDAELRNELESLLACSAEAESFLKTPALEDAAILIDNTATSLVGQRVGPYSILAQLGSGGMGEVYLAQDTRLGRRVALKTLPPFFVKDEQRLRRFEHEARAASGLNQPNIVTIHEMGMSDGRYFIAMEHIDGETLRSVMGKGRLAPADLVDVAMQVASALAAAHAAGIVHRDIKPENLMLRPDGYVKVLDFGLAKLTQQPATDWTTRPRSPGAMTTEVGVVMGTAQYMSPEQARGLGVDARTDLFSLGVVLYEMIAGRPPFEGETTSDVIAAILQNDPPPLSIEGAGIPAELGRIVTKALQKDREHRYQTSADMLVELRHLKRELEFRARQEDSNSTESSLPDGPARAGLAVETAGEPPSPTNVTVARTTSSAEFLVASIRRHKRATIVALAMSAIAVAAMAYGLYRMFGAAKVEMPFQKMSLKPLTASGKVLEAGISPDGKYMVYSIDEGNSQSLWLKQVAAAGSDRQIVPPDEARYLGATFSPNGGYIYYVKSESNHNGLFQVAIGGGASRRLMENIASGISFSPDGQRFAFLRSSRPDEETSLMIARADGTEERQLVDGILGQPAWSPDGKTIVCVLLKYFRHRPTPLLEVRVEDGQQRMIDNKRVRFNGQLAWLGDSSALIAVGTEQSSSETQLWHVSLPVGEIQRITNDLKDYRNLSVTTDGTAIVTVQSEQLSNIWIAPGGDARRATRITLGNQDRAGALCWTHDGRIVYDSLESGRVSVWIAEANGGGRRPLVDSGFRPSVSPDGRYVLFTSTRAEGGSMNIWRMDTDGGNLKQLTESQSDVLPYCSPNSQSVVYTGPGTTLWRVSIEGGEPTQLTSKWTRGAVISPNGKLMACWYRPDGARPSSQPSVAIISSEGGEPIKVFPLGRSARPPIPAPNYLRWTSDGESVLYIDTREGVSNIWSQPRDGGTPKQVTNFKTDRIFFFDWSKDEKQLALIRGTQTSDAVLITSVK